jgi:glycosyltransferase involved in cell wall biosynthesis
MDQTKHTLSIAIVTRNRPDSLQKTLDSLSIQNAQPFEIIISDDSDSDEMIEANKKVALIYGAKHILGPQKGLYANRNFVARHSLGTHFRTMDDDHEFPDNHIAICLEAIEQNADAIWTIGEYCSPDPNRSLPAPVPGQLHPMGYSYSPTDMSTYFGISCGATIYPKKVVEKNVLNLETYMFGILYLEYGSRLYNKGYTLKHLNTTFIIHHSDINNRSISSMKIINGAKVFCMFMLSFYHQRSIKNIAFTYYAILKELLTKKYTLSLVFESYRNFKKVVKEIQ